MFKSQITNHKLQISSNIKYPKLQTNEFRILLIGLLVIICNLVLGAWNFSVFAQNADDLEVTIDISSNTTTTPKIFKPNIDLSGRGSSKDNSWPQTLASKESIDKWSLDLGFSGFYRMEYDLWEINKFSKETDTQNKLLSTYEDVIKNINNSKGTVILSLFGTPAGMGKILDKRSSPVDLKAYKALIKKNIKYLSCEKKYNVWYEVWSSPDIGDFFLGNQQEYLNLYRLCAESVKELEAEFKIQIPIGGPSASWWFKNLGSNTVIAPEKSLIYELMKFCRAYHLPLDFISWHGFSSSNKVERELTIYKKDLVSLIREWLTYFNLDKSTPLIIDEWNYDFDSNVLPERHGKSFVTASFIPARLKNMSEAGIDNQIYFCLEDFQNNTEGVTRNVGVFYFEPQRLGNKSGFKATYSVFKMLNQLGPDMLQQKMNDEFVGIIPTRSNDEISLLIYNYIDPEVVKNFLASNIASLDPREREFLLNIIDSNELSRIISRQEEVANLHTSIGVKNLLKKAQEINDKANKFTNLPRNVKLSIKNLKDTYLYSRYLVDSSCGLNCKFDSVQNKEVVPTDLFVDELSVSPYSVNLIILKKKTVPLPEKNDENTTTG